MWWKREVMRSALFLGGWAIGALVLLAVVALGAVWQMGDSGLCARCHAKQTVWTAWQASAHNKTPCAACHRSADGEGLEHDVVSVFNLYLHAWNGSPSRSLVQAGDGNDVCLRCHSSGRRSSTQADLRIPHDKYMASGRPACIHCHANVIHPASSQAQRPPQKSSLPMSACIACHRQKQARVDCIACHEKPVQPLSHRHPGWNVAHGGSGQPTGAELCVDCHRLHSGEKPAAEGGLAAIRATGFCQNCHRRKPPGHDGAWQLGHAQAAGPGSQGRCDVCHGELPGSRRNTGAIACSACHGFRHDPGWDRTHPAAVRGSGMAPCFRCHDVLGCTACHVRRGVVPQTRR